MTRKMMKNTRKTDRGFVEARLLTIGFLVLLTGIGIFAFSRAHGLIQGPSIHLTSVQEDARWVSLTGTVKRASHLSINGRIVAPEQNGAFHERLFMTPGHTIMTIQARDRFDRVTEEVIPIYIPHHGTKEKESDNS